jgi:hypothetical protein
MTNTMHQTEGYVTCNAVPLRGQSGALAVAFIEGFVLQYILSKKHELQYAKHGAFTKVPTLSSHPY